MTRKFLGLILLLVCLPPLARSEPTADGLYAGFTTSMGTFWARLEFERAPRTVANFVVLAEGSRDVIDFPTAKIVTRKFYDGLTFHRVIDKFMIQGGSPNRLGTDGPGYQFSDEFHAQLKHSSPGTLSMANSGADSNGSQFFITVTNTPWLDGIHSIFGQIVEGMDIVHTISKVETDANDKPLTPVILQGVSILRRGAAAQAFNATNTAPPMTLGVVPVALSLTSSNMALLLQSRSNHLQHVFFGTPLETWRSQSFKGSPTRLDASQLRGQPQMFFRVLDGGYEP